MTTVFGKIIQGELPCDKVFENEWIIAFKDIHPLAPVHLLIVPKKEIRNLQAMEPQDFFLLGEVVRVAQILAEEFDIEEGYRLVTNNGALGGQMIFHLHFHLLGGRPLNPMLG
ncbi:MAG: histidine triad nucleotide-binding protein [Verrucomicrobia bacterium]|nr:histidine triad nucleotide-binding protein [Verrucomicrobiota bacterium]